MSMLSQAKPLLLSKIWKCLILDNVSKFHVSEKEENVKQCCQGAAEEGSTAESLHCSCRTQVQFPLPAPRGSKMPETPL